MEQKTSQQYLQEVSRQYDGLSEVWDSFPISAKKNVEVFIKKMPSQRGKALDVGCGTGRVIGNLAKYFKKAQGIDISPGMVQYAKKKYSEKENISLTTQDARQLNLPKNSFDYVVSHTTLHHLSKQDQIKTLEKIKEVIKPGGKLVIIDIVAEGLAKRNLALVRRIGATLTLFSEILQLNPQARTNYKKATHPLWMKHLKMDRFLSPYEFKKAYQSVLKDATFTSIKREYGLNNLIIVEWTKRESKPAKTLH
jgi:ubiquinone/menaquinone biosynthesis C-methylase UbiE